MTLAQSPLVNLWGGACFTGPHLDLVQVDLVQAYARITASP
jgi:hypothetical protein